MKRNLFIPAAMLAVSFMVAGWLSPAAAAGVSGAIFTTTANGSAVNANLYDSKCAVYLNGGPGPNAPAKAAGLPDGDYYFQVTDPSGQFLLSTDPVSNRRFTVLKGVIAAYTGVGGPIHAAGTDSTRPELSALTISLANSTCPVDYRDTTNDGGVYKVWATPVNDFSGEPSKVDNACGSGCFHGFIPSKSKSDNFKVKPVAPTFCLTLQKELVDTITGLISIGTEWPFTILDPLGVNNQVFTDSNGESKTCGLAAGTYTVSEDGETPVGLIVNGASITPQPVYSFTWTAGKPAPVIKFQNPHFTPLPGRPEVAPF